MDLQYQIDATIHTLLICFLLLLLFVLLVGSLVYRRGLDGLVLWGKLGGFGGGGNVFGYVLLRLGFLRGMLVRIVCSHGALGFLEVVFVVLSFLRLWWWLLLLLLWSWWKDDDDDDCSSRNWFDET